MTTHFYSQDNTFIDNISRHHLSEISGKPIFDINWNDGEYIILVSPESIEELKELCNILCKYASDYAELSKLTGDFLEYGRLHEYFGEKFDEGYEMVEEAINYTKSLFVLGSK